MPEIHDNIRARRPSIIDWYVIQMIMTTMKPIVGIIILNQYYGKELILSDSIVYMFWIYTYCSGGNINEDVSKHLATIVEDRGNSQDADNLLINLLEVNYKMRYRVKEKLTNELAPLLKITAPTKYRYWFALFLDPWYVMEIKGTKTFHQSENVDTKTLFQHILPKFYEYIIVAELDFNTNTPQILEGKILYLNNKFFIYQNTVSGTEITDSFYVMNWYQIQQMKPPMLTRFAENY